MALEREIEELAAGDVIDWHCPDCGNTFTKPVGKGIVMSLLSKGSVSLPCPKCNTTVDVDIENIDVDNETAGSDYDPIDEYPM